MVGLAWDRHPNSNKNQLGRRKGPRAPHNSKPRRANPIRCEGSRVTLLALVPSLPGPRAKARYLSKVIQSTEDLFAPSSVWTAGFCKHAAFGAARRCLHAPFGGRGSGRDEWFTQESLLTPAPSGVMSVFPFKGSFYKDIYVFTFTDMSGTPWSSLRFLCPTNRSDFLTTGLLLTTPKCSLIISTIDKKVSNSTGLGVLTTLPTGVFKLSGQRETLSQCGV